MITSRCCSRSALTPSAMSRSFQQGSFLLGRCDFDPEHDNDFRAVFAKLSGSVDADPVGLAGVQPKVSAAMLSAPIRTRSGPAILKLNPVQYPLIVENERFFMTMAGACGLRGRQHLTAA